jgi:RNA polymerase sigma-70 factor (ECF subfamily)
MFLDDAKMWQVKDMPGRPIGLFDAQYRAFLETVSGARAQLHRYCTRMTGSRLGGEDLKQETLFDADTKIETLDDVSRKPWLFRRAHNRCIDFLRRRHARERAETTYSDDIGVVAAEPAATDGRRAIERLVGRLPPMERACVLLKDVFDYSLEETAELVDATVGGVKFALSRARAKLADLPAEPAGGSTHVYSDYRCRQSRAQPPAVPTTPRGGANEAVCPHSERRSRNRQRLPKSEIPIAIA